MPGTLAIGYDVEVGATGGILARFPDHELPEALDQDVGRKALKTIGKIHEAAGAPGTLFVCGLTLLRSPREIESLMRTGLFEIAQHTYSHVPFREVRWRNQTIPGSPYELLEFEVNITQQAIASTLGIASRGLRTPFGYYEGLLGQADIQKMLVNAGLEYVSSWGRNVEGGFPVPLEVQPFAYTDQDPGRTLLELPFQFWLDSAWFHEHGSESGQAFAAGLEVVVDEIAERDLFFGVCFHDWTVMKYDAEATGWITRLIQRASHMGVDIVTYADVKQSSTSGGGKRQ